MATVDTSMYNNLQAPKIASPFENAAMMAQIQQGQAQNRLAQMKFAEAERADTERNMLAGAYRDSYNEDGTQDRNKLFKTLATGGQGQLVPGLQKQYNEADASSVELKNKQLAQTKAQIENGLKQFEAVGQIMSGVSDQPSYDVARQQIAQILGPDAAANIPPVYDPAVIEQGRAKAMGVKDQLEQKWKELDAGNKERDFRQKTDEFDYRQQNDAANRAQQREASIRTDSRSRELNATKVEENTLKREAKADTANLTKQSQLASFDTMIGTLDRLSTHKGLPNATGMMNYLPDRKGSDVSNFKAELESFKSQAFIPMVSQLKGMGALSDAEGKKLTAAVGALDTDVMSEQAVRESIARIIVDMKAAKDRVAGIQPNGNKASEYLNGAKDQADFAARVNALKAKGWTDDKIRAAYGK